MKWFHILLLKTLPLVELIIVVLVSPSSFSLGWVSKKKSDLLLWLIKASQRGEGGNIMATSASHAHLFHSLLLSCSFSYTAGLKWPLSPSLIPSSDLLVNGITPTEHCESLPYDILCFPWMPLDSHQLFYYLPWNW